MTASLNISEMPAKSLNILGLAMRARKLSYGETGVVDIKSGKACLVLLANDASERTGKHIRNTCAYYHVPCLEEYSREELSASIGKGNVVMVAILDKGFASAFEK